MQGYDIIGDIHGCNLTLVKLLTELGYQPAADGIYKHQERKVIFLGDFIDRGPGQRARAGSSIAIPHMHDCKT